MKSLAILLTLVGVCSCSAVAEAGQASGESTAPAQPVDRIAQAYEGFLLAHRLEAEGDIQGAVRAYSRAMELDPEGADIAAELAALYLRQDRFTEAIAAAEKALAVSPSNREAHRVLGTIYGSRGGSGGRGRTEALERAVTHLEQAVEYPETSRLQAEVSLRAMLARLYVMTGKNDKAIPLLAELVKEEPRWQDGAPLLVQAYVGAERGDEAVAWLEEAAPDNPRLYSTLADLYSQNRQWRSAAVAFDRALEAFPQNVDFRIRYASVLLGMDGEADLVRARDVLREAVSIRPNDEGALYLLAQAERRSGDLDAAERTSRRLIAEDGRNPRGYAALAEALEERRRYSDVIAALEPAVATFRAATDSGFRLALLLPHLGFAYQQVGQFDQAILVFEEARKLSPRDPDLTVYLIQAHLAAKNFSEAADLAMAARADRPSDVRLSRLEAEALIQGGRANEGIALLQDLLSSRGNDPAAHIALAQAYSGAKRDADAVKVLQEAQASFPDEVTIIFELGATFERQGNFVEAEAAFRQLLAREPDHSSTLNYLGYMLADRGERLGESVDLIQRALRLDPDNGAYLDSLGWAYYKEGKLDLALENLERAADQLADNAVVQDHYGDVLFGLGRYDDAIEAWTRALAGDDDFVDPVAVEEKIESARRQLPRP